MPYFPNPWLFQQAPPQQFQFQSQSKRDQDFEEGLNRLRKEYATAPIERKLFPDQKYNLGEEVRSNLISNLISNLLNFHTESLLSVFRGKQSYEEILLKVLLSVGFQTNDMLAL